MRGFVTLAAADGHKLQAYRSAPAGQPRAALVVIQEIFGVNGHIRAVCDGFAADGYLTIAPAMYDRVEPGFDVGYGPADIERGRILRADLPAVGQIHDVAAAIAHAAQSGLKVGIVGYCYGGTVAWVSAANAAGLSAAVCYYGGGWAENRTLVPRCPTMMHFAAKDAFIPVSLAAEIKAEQPQVVTHVYDADHGFNCDQRVHYDGFAAVTARRRTLAWFEAVLG